MSERFVLDGLPLQVRSAGIAVYVERLVRASAALRPEATFLLYGIGGPARWPLAHAAAAEQRFPPNVEWQRSALYPAVMGYPFPGIPRLLPFTPRGGTAALFHATNYAAPRTGALPLVVTVHDLALLRFPELGTAALRRIVGRVRAAAAAARLVIADSEATARDVAELLGVDAGRLRVVYPGCDPRFLPLDPGTARRTVASRHGLTAPYLLHVGTLEPRKNLPRLLEAFAALRRTRRIPHQLVLASADGWGAAAVAQAIDALALHDAVRRLGGVADEDLPALYAAADVFVYPSLYEGFGLPVIEALACGTPVVTADVSSLPEIAGDAALLVDPRNPDAIAAAIGQVLTDAGTARDLRARGPARARRFTWERCARETLAVYDEVIRAPRLAASSPARRG